MTNKFSSFLHIFFVTLFLGLSSFFGVIFFVAHHVIIDFSPLENYNPGHPTILLDDQGNEWARFALDKKEYVPLDKMPEKIIHAFVCAEDHTFFDHAGVSFKGIVRSLFANVYHRKKVQGASTITQQLVRLLFFNAKKTYIRKLKEQLYAILIERQYTKEQILEVYLNHVYFGHGIYGVSAAAKRFWGKELADLSVAQAATLASIMRSPVHYSPISAPQPSVRRRNYVLDWMYKLHYISESELQSAQKEELGIIALRSDVCAPHLKEAIRIELEERFGKEAVYTGGLVVQTTLNLNMQKTAQTIFHEKIQSLKETMHPDIDGGMVTIHSCTGAVKVMIGGYDFSVSKFNRALQAKRQMGSVFKPFVYAAALEKEYSFVDVMVDEPVQVPVGNQMWEPRNNTRKFIGSMTLAYALSYSNNIIPIKLLLAMGPQPIIDVATRCHIPGPIPQYASLAIGCVDASVIQVVSSFNVFACNGLYVDPYYIVWIKDKLGNKIYRAQYNQERVLDSSIVSRVARVLTLSFQRLKKNMKDVWFDDGQVLGKTGTTNDSRTCWFCGATQEYTTAVYVGTDDNKPLGEHVYGSKVSFPIWYHFHKQLENKPGTFFQDSSLQEVSIDLKTGKISYDVHNPNIAKILV